MTDTPQFSSFSNGWMAPPKQCPHARIGAAPDDKHKGKLPYMCSDCGKRFSPGLVENVGGTLRERSFAEFGNKPKRKARKGEFPR